MFGCKKLVEYLHNIGYEYFRAARKWHSLNCVRIARTVTGTSKVYEQTTYWNKRKMVFKYCETLGFEYLSNTLSFGCSPTFDLVGISIPQYMYSLHSVALQFSSGFMAIISSYSKPTSTLGC